MLGQAILQHLSIVTKLNCIEIDIEIGYQQLLRMSFFSRNDFMRHACRMA